MKRSHFTSEQIVFALRQADKCEPPYDLTTQALIALWRNDNEQTDAIYQAKQEICDLKTKLRTMGKYFTVKDWYCRNCRFFAAVKDDDHDSLLDYTLCSHPNNKRGYGYLVTEEYDWCSRWTPKEETDDDE